MLLLSMVNQWGPSNFRGVYAKGIHYHPIFSYYVRRLSVLLLLRQRGRGLSQASPLPKEVHILLTYFFVDDSLLFCKANSMEWWRMMKILEKYEMSSGQRLNMNKTSIFLGRNTSQAKRQEITNLS
jgi:hypothetical protein